jgi:hypothetical protein
MVAVGFRNSNYTHKLHMVEFACSRLTLAARKNQGGTKESTNEVSNQSDRTNCFADQNTKITSCCLTTLGPFQHIHVFLFDGGNTKSRGPRKSPHTLATFYSSSFPQFISIQ